MKRFSILFVLLYTVNSVPFTHWHNIEDDVVLFIDGEYKYNWFEAWNECASKNMSLITLDSEQKEKMLTKLLREVFNSTRNLWLGANDLAEEGKFTWASTGAVFDYSNWSLNRSKNNWRVRNPDNYQNKEHCVHYWRESEFEWNDNVCGTKMGLICEDHHITQLMKKDLKALYVFLHKGIGRRGIM
uniref:Lectin n=1 Tax=Glossina morsitans morsitans TaxID=37546 RepID=Q27U53_GLOMM|nr:lectin [Glossina morsitans morsitans]